MTWDGASDQAGLEHEALRLTGAYPNFSIMGLREMVVVDRKFVDEVGNRSRSYVEYACRDLVTGEVVPGMRRVHMFGGLDDGDDSVLRPASARLPGASSGTFDKRTSARDSDGDRVLVGFLEGVRSRAVILGVFTHSASTYSARKEDGDRRFSIHKNTSVETKKDGSYHITRTNAAGEVVTVVINADGDVAITGPATRSYRLNYEGADTVHLGANTTDHAVLGDRFMATYNGLVTVVNALIAHYLAHGASAPVGPVTTASPMTSADLSTIVKVQ